MLNKLITAGILAIAFWPGALKAQIFQPPPSDQPDTAAGVDAIEGSLEGSGVTGTDDIGLFVIRFVNFLLPFLALAAFVAMVYGGFLYVTAFGNDDQISKAKKLMIYALGGLILVLLSFAIVQLFTTSLVEGLSAPDSGQPPAGEIIEPEFIDSDFIQQDDPRFDVVDPRIGF